MSIPQITGITFSYFTNTQLFKKLYTKYLSDIYMYVAVLQEVCKIGTAAMLRAAVFHMTAVLLFTAAVAGSPALKVPHSEVNSSLAFSSQSML